MKKEFRKRAQQALATIVAELDSSCQLEHYVDEILTGSNQDYCGVLVSGFKGVGKTFFVENYLQKFESTHPVLIARHYQQHEKIPYFGFKYCISDYLSKIYDQFSKKEFHEFSVSL